MTHSRFAKKLMCLAVLHAFNLGCTTGVTEGGAGATPDDALNTGTSWEEFLGKVYREPDSGMFIVDGDTPIEGEKLLREFYEKHVRENQLIVNRIGSADDRWDNTRKLDLTYCVSTSFGSNHAAVVTAMNNATAAWEAAANVNFNHVSAQDGACNRSNTNVVFDVNPTSGGQYLARAFFPSTGRSNRNVLIDGSSFRSGAPSLVGILRHELGHALGFRHEHSRPEAGTCFEDNSWRALTPYDSASVMHYPQCRGTSSTLALTERDRQGAAALYGAPSGSTTPSAPAVPAAVPVSSSGTLTRGQQTVVGPFAVVAGSIFEVVMTGTGDPDLYVRFGSAPTTTAFNCRPYLDGPNETCRLTVPSGQSSAYVMVRGYTSATYQLQVTHTPPTSGQQDTLAPTFAGVTGAQAISAAQVDLTWTAATDNMTAASGIVYDVFVSAGTSVSFTTPRTSTAPGATKVSITGLTADTQYTFAVRARDAAGNRDSNTTIVTTRTLTAASPTGGDNPAFEEQVLSLVNQRRAAGATCGTTVYAAAPALVMNNLLRMAARNHSEDMATQHYFSHNSLDGRTPFQRIAATGYVGSPQGENIAAGQSTPEAVVSGWMGSTGHCVNIMNPQFRSIGVGYAYDAAAPYRHYWTQNFGGQ